MTVRVKVAKNGYIFRDGQLVGMINDKPPNSAVVFLIHDGESKCVATFSHFRPKASARAWIKFVLARKSPRQIMKYLETGKSAMDYAKALGFVSVAEAEAILSAGKLRQKTTTGPVIKPPLGDKFSS